MLPKESRLNLKKDFKRVASGKKLETKYLKIFIKEDPPTRSARLGPLVGIATSSKVFKNATQRNRARRLTSSAFQSIIHFLPSIFQIMALPKRSILEVKSQDVLLDLEEALKHEKIIN